MTDVAIGEIWQGRHPDDHPDFEPTAQPASDDGMVHIGIAGTGNQWIEIDADAIVVKEDWR